MNLSQFLNECIKAYKQEFSLREIPVGKHQTMRYPKLVPLMNLSTHSYEASDFGNLFTMYTKGMMGMMQLMTIVCTPNEGTDMPVLLIDTMVMGKKKIVFVEYYDCTDVTGDYPLLNEIAEKYGQLPDYSEKDAWYIKERTPYSLIKTVDTEQQLQDMILDSIHAYGREFQNVLHTSSKDSLTGLQNFIDRMVREGNPSSATLQKILGEEGAEAFFRQVVMPASPRRKG